MASEKKIQERYEFLDLSDVDEESRIQLTSALYSNDVLNNNNNNNNNNTKQDIECCGSVNDHNKKNSITVDDNTSIINIVISANLKANCFFSSNSPAAIHDILSKKCTELNSDSRVESINNHISEMKMSPQGSSAHQQPNQQQVTQQHQQLTIQQQNINNHQHPPNQQPMYQIPAYVAAQGQHGGMYQMQMLPQSMGSNVYVSNVTANVNVHGYMAAHPQQMMTPTYLTTNEQQSQNTSSTVATAGTIVHESQSNAAIMNHNNNLRGNSGNGGRRIRTTHNSRSGGNSSMNRRSIDYQPTNNSRNHQQNQQEMLQHQPSMIEPQQIPGYTQYYTLNPYHPHPHHGPAYYATGPSHMGGHPTAQHATGTPLYIAASPMPMHAYQQMYYPPGVIYQPAIIPQQEYQQIVDTDKNSADEHHLQQNEEENQQQMPPGVVWQGPQGIEYTEQQQQQQHLQQQQHRQQQHQQQPQQQQQQQPQQQQQHQQQTQQHHQQLQQQQMQQEDYQTQHENHENMTSPRPHEQQSMVKHQVSTHCQHILNPNVPNFVVASTLIAVPVAPVINMDNEKHSQVQFLPQQPPPQQYTNNNNTGNENMNSVNNNNNDTQQQQTIDHHHQKHHQKSQQGVHVSEIVNQTNSNIIKANVPSVATQPPNVIDTNGNNSINKSKIAVTNSDNKNHSNESFSNLINNNNNSKSMIQTNLTQQLHQQKKLSNNSMKNTITTTTSNIKQSTFESAKYGESINKDHLNKSADFNVQSSPNNMQQLQTNDKLMIKNNSNNKPPAWNNNNDNNIDNSNSKQLTASVAVSAIPIKEYRLQATSTVHAQNQQQHKLPPPPFTTNAVKMNPTSPTVPTVSNARASIETKTLLQTQQPHQTIITPTVQQHKMLSAHLNVLPTINKKTDMCKVVETPSSMISDSIPSSMSQQPAFQQHHQQHPQPIKNNGIELKKVESVPKQHHKEVTATSRFTNNIDSGNNLVDTNQSTTAQIVNEAKGLIVNIAPSSSTWASLFKKSAVAASAASLPINGATIISISNMMSNVDYNPMTGNSSGIATAKRPVAKVSPFDGTNTNQAAVSTASDPSTAVSSKSADSDLSYSAASAQGLNPNNVTQKSAPKPILKPQADDLSIKLGDFFSKYKIDATSISIFPRGLVNRSNYCYINATLQALVSCPPFYHLIKAIPKQHKSYNRVKTQSLSSTPFIDAMIDLVQEFSLLPLSRINRDKTKKYELPEIQQEPAFEPIQIHKILNGIRSDIFQVEGRQEDAEEFLGCVLNRLNDEILELIKLVEKPVKQETPPPPPNQNCEQEDGDDWQVICGGRSNKGTITRTTDFGRTPISDIFGGKLRSRVHREGDYSTDNIQPFFTLQLDIEKATSVYQALENLVGRDQLEGVTCSKTNQEIAAWQQVTLEELPVVLILHLKCFDYKMDGCTKIVKTIDFPVELKIDSKIMSLSKTKYNLKQRTYKLFAVVYHDGKEASKGHYITDVFHVGYGHWIRYDDSVVKSVSENVVLHPQPPRVPYLLYYRRCDTFGTQTNANNSNTYHYHK